MTWPTDDLDTTEFDQGTDNPSIARSMLYNLINKVKSILANRGVADGIADLDASGKVPNARLNLGVAGGAASLDGAGKVPLGQLPTGSGNGLDADTLDGNEASVFAKLASPAFTGTPTAPTQASGDNSTKLANTAFVQQELAGFSSAPGPDTIGASELKEALDNGGYVNVSAGGYSTVPTGWTLAQCSSTDLYFEIYIPSLSAWVRNGSGGGIFFGPVSGNVRVYNAGTATRNYHYRRLT